MAARRWTDMGPGGETEKYCREICTGRWWFVEILDMEACTGEKHEDGKYFAEVSVVDVFLVLPQSLSSAIYSMGYGDYFDEVENTRDDGRLQMCADMLFDHGTRGRIWSSSSNNLHKLKREAFSRSRYYDENPHDLDSQLDRGVNAIGDSARSFMTGSFGFTRAEKAITHDPKALIAEYAKVLQEQIASKDEEIRQLKEELAALQQGGNNGSTGLVHSQANV